MKSNINKITIISDKSSWMNKYNELLVKKLKKINIKSRIIYDYKNIKKNDLLFIFSYSKKIPLRYLKLNKYNIVAHGSNLPSGKGFSPITWEILKNKFFFYISFFQANTKIDDGNIFLKEKFSIKKTDLLEDWRKIVGKIIIKNAFQLSQNIGNFKAKSQVGKSTFYRRRRPEDSELNINKSIRNQFNLLRTVDNKNYPAYFLHEGQKYIITIKKIHENIKKN